MYIFKWGLVVPQRYTKKDLPGKWRQLFSFGTSESGISGDKDTELYGMADTWIIKTIRQVRSYGKRHLEEIRMIFYTTWYCWIMDILFGSSSLSAPSGNKTAPKIGWVDYWLVEMDTSGSSISQSSYGGDDNDILRCIVPTADGGLILAGKSESDAYGTKTENSRGGYDYWLVKLTLLERCNGIKHLVVRRTRSWQRSFKHLPARVFGMQALQFSCLPEINLNQLPLVFWLVGGAAWFSWCNGLKKTIGGSSLDYVYDGIELPKRELFAGRSIGL